MITRFATLTSRLILILSVLFTIAACGGGGGGGGGGFLGEGGGGSDGATYFLQVALNDPDGNPTNTVNPSDPGTLQVLVTRKNAKGAAVPNIIVKASTDSGLLDPPEGSKLTNAEGLVTFGVQAGDGRGAGTIVVSVEDENGDTVSESIPFQLGYDNLRLGRFESSTFIDGEIALEPPGTIPSQGQVLLSISIVEENDRLIKSGETVRISSPCLDSGSASLTPESPIAAANGVINATYEPNGCVGYDTVTAELVGQGAQAIADLEIAPPTANGLTFVSAEPQLIVLKGTGGGPDRVESSVVTFQAVNSNNQPLSGVELMFDLTTDVGGLRLNPISAITDASGNAATTVFSGDVATVVRVIATGDAGLGAGDISAVSDVLTVSTGLPDQDSMTFGVIGGFVAEEAMIMNGITRTLTVLMADKFNNPVPDGTAAVFETEYGSIDPSCETGRRNGDRLGGTPKTGQCSVQWLSQNPRYPLLSENKALVKTIWDTPYNCSGHNGISGPCPNDLGLINGGRSTVVVTAIGEESFSDSNGNGIFDQEEAEAGLWENLTEAFLDVNENGFFDDATEACIANPDTTSCKHGREDKLKDFNGNGVFDADGDDPGNGYPDDGTVAMYNGLLCPKEGDVNEVGPAGWCSRDLLNVRASTVVILSDDPNWAIALYTNVGGNPVSGSTQSGISYTAYVSDTFNSQPPADSTVEVEASAPCTIEGATSFDVPNSAAPGAFGATFTQAGEITYDSCEDPIPNSTGELTITLSPKNGGGTFVETWSCKANVIDTSAGKLCPD